MTIDQRKQCDGLDDSSIMETMEWLKDQCILLNFTMERAAEIVTNPRGAEKPPKAGGSEQ
jgi:hypothetical protein